MTMISRDEIGLPERVFGIEPSDQAILPQEDTPIPLLNLEKAMKMWPKNYRGFIIDRDPQYHHLAVVFHPETNEPMFRGSRFQKQKEWEPQIDAYIHQQELRTRLEEIHNAKIEANASH